MTENKKMRKFEGTCYIPGEQLAMMAKYYRGANLNLNLTLVEDEAIMKESLDGSCWCSKLDDADRMKLRHMKGDEWALSHEHHLGWGHANAMDRRSMNCCLGVGKSQKELETGIDKGTDTMSLYNPPPRRDYYDPRFDVWRGDHYDGYMNSRRKDSQRRGFSPPHNIDDYRPNHNINAYYSTNSQRFDYDYAHQYRRSVNHGIEDDIASRYTAEESDNDIKCAVCKKDVCAVCKNPIRGWPCHCKCVIPNAGLCNECDMQCEKDSGKDDCASRDQPRPQTETNHWTSLMLLLMGSQMFNRGPNTGPSCQCDVKNSIPITEGGSDSASASSSCSCCSEKVRKIFLYDCGASENTEQKGTKKPKNSSGGESSGCGCCKCSKKEKRGSRKKSTYSPVREESNDSKQSGGFEKTSLSHIKSTKSLDEKSNNTKLFATTEKNRHSVQPKRVGGNRKSTTSTKYLQASGKKENGRRSWFRNPIVDDGNKPGSSKNGKPNNYKRQRSEQIDSDNESQTSHESEEANDTRNKSKSSSDIKDFLVWLPKIKSDLEQLLRKTKDESKMPTNVENNDQKSSVPISQNYLTNVTTLRNNVPFITHPAAYEPRPVGLLCRDTGSSLNYSPTRNIHANYDYSVVQNRFSVQRNGYNNVNLDVSHQNHTNEVLHPLDQQYPYFFNSLCPDEMSKPLNNLIRNGCNDDLLSNRVQSNIKQKFTDTSNTLMPTNNPLAEISDSRQMFQQSTNSLWQAQQIGVAHTQYEDKCDLGPSRKRNVFGAYDNPDSLEPIGQKAVKNQNLCPERTEFRTRQMFQPSNNMWPSQQIGITHTKYEDMKYEDKCDSYPSRKRNLFGAYNYYNTLEPADQKSIEIVQPDCGMSVTHQVFQPSSDWRKSSRIVGTKYEDTRDSDPLGQQNALGPCNNQNTGWKPIDQESVKIPNLFTERYKQPLLELSTTRQVLQPSNHLWQSRQIAATHSKYEDSYNLQPSRQQNNVLPHNNQNQVDEEPVEIPSFAVPTAQVMENVKTTSFTDGNKQGRISKGLEDNQDKMNVEGSLHVDQKDLSKMNIFKIEGSSKNVITIGDDFDAVKEKLSNDPVQSSDSKPTSDQFISAVDVDEQSSEDGSLSERELKQTFDNTNRQASVECPRQINSQSIGPGRFKVTPSTNTPHFNLSNGSPEYMRNCHTEKIIQDVDATTKVHSKQNKPNDKNPHCPLVKNSSNASIEVNDCRTNNVESFNVVISSEKITEKSTCEESQRNESTLSETLDRVTDGHDKVSSNLELRALSPALTVDARFYNLIDQIESTSAAANDSQNSLHCGVAHSSPPSSEENTELSQLPREYSELLIVAGDKAYCGHPGNSVKRTVKVPDLSGKWVLTQKAPPQNESDRTGQLSPAFGVNISGERNRCMTAIQMAKFKLAQEAIQSMVNNVNDVLACIDSESESNISGTPSSYEDRERQSFFVHIQSDESINKAVPKAISQTHETIVEKIFYDQTAHKTSATNQRNNTVQSTNRRISRSQEASIVATNLEGPSSFSSRESHLRSPRTLASLNHTISRERKFFVMDSSRSNSSVFTEKLRQSLAQETCSPNLSAVLLPEEHTTRNGCEITRTCSSKK